MRKLVMVLIALVIVTSGCGSDDDGGGDALASDAADDPVADGTDDGTDNGAGDPGGETASGDSNSDWCQAIRSAEGDDGPLDFDLFGLTPEELEARFTENVATLEAWESTAPPEIRSQVTTLVDSFRTVVDLADEADWDLLVLGTDPDFQAAFDVPALEAAADDVDAYSRDVCGVDLGVGGASTGQETTPSIPSVGDGDAATQFLETFGLPPNFLNDEQMACITGELEAVYPDGLPADLALNVQTAELFETVGAACGIGAP